jgi:hypothetical protein
MTKIGEIFKMENLGRNQLFIIMIMELRLKKIFEERNELLMEKLKRLRQRSIFYQQESVKLLKPLNHRVKHQ